MVRKFFTSHKKRGFTLIELTITIGILGLALTATGGVLISVVRSFQKQAEIQRVERNGDLATRVISEKVRKAKNVELNTITVNGNPASYLAIYGTNSAGADTLDYIGYYPGSTTGTCPSLQNGFIFMQTDSNPATPTPPDPSVINSDRYKVTSDKNDGVNISAFSVSISNGIPVEVSVTIDVESSQCGTIGSTIQKEFTSFATARASY